MKLYATMNSERDARTVKKGGDMYIEIELSTFGKVIGQIILETNTDADNVENQYHIKYHPRLSDEWHTIEEGHKTRGLIQRMK